MFVCIYVCMYVCMYVYMFVCGIGWQVAQKMRATAVMNFLSPKNKRF